MFGLLHVNIQSYILWENKLIQNVITLEEEIMVPLALQLSSSLCQGVFSKGLGAPSEENMLVSPFSYIGLS